MSGKFVMAKMVTNNKFPINILRKLYYHTPSKNLDKMFQCSKRHICSSLHLMTINKEKTDFSIVKHLINKVTTTGPISVAEFMRETLTNQNSGYYMNRNMLGHDGDFVTSPELSQMFGELIGIWFINEWMALGSPKDFQLVEMGPGSGALSGDILRTFSQLKRVFRDSKMTLHLVEVSPTLSEIQHQTLSNTEIAPTSVLTNCYKSGMTKEGISIFWHKNLNDVPKGRCTFFVAHEFFDALPVHKFKKDKGIWKEIFVDVCPKKKSLHYVLIPQQTLAAKSLVKQDERRNHIEVCPQAGIIIQDMASRIVKDSGSALIVDYGHFGTKEDTLRAFKSHTLTDVFKNIGDSDLTADVDFRYLTDCIQEYDVIYTEPVLQHNFLKNMGSEARLKMLLNNTKDDKTKKNLNGSYEMLMNKMGERFKFFAITSGKRKADILGFHEIK